MKRILSIPAFLFSFFLNAQFDTTLIHYNSEGVPVYFKNQIIVRFSPGVLNMEMVDSIEFDTGVVEDYVNPDVLQFLIDSGHYDVDLAGLTCSKVYKNLTPDITYSISRMGDTILMDSLWATFLIEWPNDATLSEEEVCDSLNTFFPIVQYAEPNYLYQIDVPNDLYYGNQLSLSKNAAPPSSGGINVEPAWNIEVGKPHIRVGVYDHVILWAHEDFGNGTFAGSKIGPAWDFYSAQPVSSVTDPGNIHGTGVAGIIGAIRNNNKGVAGIAGGDNALGNTGVNLFSMGIGIPNTRYILANDRVAPAIVEGSSWNPNKNYGYGFHIQNHSWSGTTFSSVLEDACKTSYLNKCILVASRGNDGSTVPNYPACYSDNWLINVGASGTDGRHKVPDFPGDWESSYGSTIDLVAPGQGTETFTTSYFSGPNPSYSTFNGTSAAAPHVAGTASLMLSQQNSPNINDHRNLCPEDVEFLLQKYAIDVNTSPYPVGYDAQNGWGLLNAGLTMQNLDWPKYQVFHSSDKAPNSTSSSKIKSLEPLGPFIEGGYEVYYWADVYEVTQTYSETFPVGTQILNSWKRHSEKAGYSSSIPPKKGFTDREFTYNYTISGTTINITTVTHCWHLKRKTLTSYSLPPPGISSNISEWRPSLPPDSRPAYSVHIYNNSFTGTGAEIADPFKLAVYPNPAENYVNLSYYTENVTDILFLLNDMQGRTVTEFKKASNAGSNIDTIETGELAKGVYIIKIISEEGISSQKIIKL